MLGRMTAGRIASVVGHKPLLCTVRQGCEKLAIGKTKMHELIARGVVDTVKIGKSRLIKVPSLEKLAEHGAP